MQMETLEAVHKESKRLPPVTKVNTDSYFTLLLMYFDCTISKFCKILCIWQYYIDKKMISN